MRGPQGPQGRPAVPEQEDGATGSSLVAGTGLWSRGGGTGQVRLSPAGRAHRAHIRREPTRRLWGYHVRRICAVQPAGSREFTDTPTLSLRGTADCVVLGCVRCVVEELVQPGKPPRPREPGCGRMALSPPTS